MTDRDDIDAFIFFGVETDKFLFPEPPEGAKEEYGDWYIEGHYVNQLDYNDLGQVHGVKWFSMNAYSEHPGEKKYLGIVVAKHENCWDHATELDFDYMKRVVETQKKWKELFPDVPGRLFLITHGG